MLLNAIEGVIEKGKIRLREEVSLPENTKVYVIVAPSTDTPTFHIRTPHLANPEQAAEFRKQVVEYSVDAKV